MKKKIISGIVLMLASLIMLTIINVPTFNEQVIKFESTYKDKAVELEASYYECDDAEYAVLICPGYSCDREKWLPMASLFRGNGLTVMTFDYSGQGNSDGTIGFDNAKNDCIPEEIDDALEKLHELSGIDYDHIILVGHSMGGRSILRLLADYNREGMETNVSYKDIRNVILLSPEVNYEYSAQASLFAGTSDESTEPWKSYSNSDIGNANIYLFGSIHDDVVSGYDILAIYKHLGGNVELENKVYEDSTVVSNNKLTVKVSDLTLHSYMMYSGKYAGFVSEAIKDITGSISYDSNLFYLIYPSWILALVGLALLLSGLNTKTEYASSSLTIIDEKKFLIHKLIAWLPGLLIAFLLCCICVIIPFGSPIMNIPYMLCIAGYGIIMFIYYRRGKFKGTSGKLELPTLKCKVKDYKFILIFVGIVLYIWYILRMSMYRLLPLNSRLFWLVVATILMSIGYYISNVENGMLKRINASKKTIILYNIIQYFALFLFVLFYFIIKSYSGFIGQIQNMICMYIFVLPLGKYVGNKVNNQFIGAIVSAFLFQALMITSAAIIAMF